MNVMKILCMNINGNVSCIQKGVMSLCFTLEIEKFKSFRTGSTEGAFVKNSPTTGMLKLISSPTSDELVNS